MEVGIVFMWISPTEVASRVTILSCGTATTLCPLISMILWPTLTPPLSAMPPRNKLQITPFWTLKLTAVSCPPVVEVKIKRPDTKYQLGFSVQNGVICSFFRGGIAERGGVRVGHRIIEINGQSVVAVPHERIVTLLATSVGEIQMKTMPTSMYRLLTGQETPVYI
jgi:predicted metalloprotease with PDZ domain